MDIPSLSNANLIQILQKDKQYVEARVCSMDEQFESGKRHMLDGSRLPAL